MLKKRLPAIFRFQTYLFVGETEIECCSSHSNSRPLNLVFIFLKSSKNRSLSKNWVLIFQLVVSRASSRLGCGVADLYYSSELNQNYRLDYHALCSCSAQHLCLTSYYIFHRLVRSAIKKIFGENSGLKRRADLVCSPCKFYFHRPRLLCAYCCVMRLIRWDHSRETLPGIRFHGPPTQIVS